MTNLHLVFRQHSLQNIRHYHPKLSCMLSDTQKPKNMLSADSRTSLVSPCPAFEGLAGFQIEIKTEIKMEIKVEV